MLKTSEVNHYFTEFIGRQLPSILEKDAAPMSANRAKEAAVFAKKGVPAQDDEMWREFDWNKIIKNTYTLQQQADDYRPVETFFNCEINNIDSYLFTFLNGWYVHKDAPLTIFPNGVTIGSLRAAKEMSATLIQPYLSDMDKTENTGLYHLNGALWQDGFFIHVPDNVHLERPVQVANLVKTHQDLFINTKNLAVVGKNSSLKLVHCDDTLESKNTFINGVTEIIIDKKASFDYFKMENKDNNSVLLNNVMIYQYEQSSVNTNTCTFNGGLVHNSINCSLLQPRSSINFNGLYMADKNQNVTNCLRVNHFSSDCTSRQLYNGMLDDSASARFVGHIYVAPNAQKTEAYQLNKNILLTDESSVFTKPFLEIYADDVKCSHGATVGQLDENAVFYMRSRGICKKTARTLLMHAFAKEILNNMSIASLGDYTGELVRKRLTGENISCSMCNHQCENKAIDFEIHIPEV